MNRTQPTPNRKTILAGVAMLLTAPLFIPSALGQGCMATRVSPPMLGARDSARYLHKGQWEASLTFRHYEADRHFYDQNKERVPANAPAVVRTVFDASLTRMLTDRTSLTMSVPVQWGTFDRSPSPPHTGSKDRASGLGDIAVTLRRWMLDPATHPRQNIRLGLGIKLPTGKNDVETNRRVNIAPAGSPPDLVWRRGPADMAIQPGDGGLGIILGVEGFQQVGPSSLLYGELTYLANPRGHNGVNNQWSGSGPYVPNSTSSVPDYFLGRVGVAWGEPLGWKGGSLLLGLRWEGQPVYDLIGSEAGFRRPGYTLAVEPGIGYGFGSWSVFVSVPITTYRVRWLSVDEKRAGRTQAVSAAFADYNLLMGVTRRW